MQLDFKTLPKNTGRAQTNLKLLRLAIAAMAVSSPFFARFRCALRVIFEVAAAYLASFTTRFRCSFPIFREVSRTTTPLGHNHLTVKFIWTGTEIAYLF